MAFIGAHQFGVHTRTNVEIHASGCADCP